MSEGELARRAAAGDDRSYAALVRLHQSKVRGFLRRMTRGDHALADDLAQETFLEAHRKIAAWRGEGSFGGWLYAIAYSRYLMAARRRKLEPLDEAEQMAAPGSAESDSALRLDLETAMAKLSPPERAALTLCYALGLSNEEAAMRLAMPLGTLKSHVLRGREKLKAMLHLWQAEAAS
jgi:RNA polymerase sigma factor (sigma-70 family)